VGQIKTPTPSYPKSHLKVTRGGLHLLKLSQNENPTAAMTALRQHFLTSNILQVTLEM
jgi:hypothetical protein